MHDRCYNAQHGRYHRYGGRGILVDKPWHDFDRYYADTGDCPHPGWSLDRTDNDASYGPGNWRWAPPLWQSRNALTGQIIRIVDKRGRDVPQWKAAEILGVSTDSMQKRMAKYRKKGHTVVKLELLKIRTRLYRL